MTLHFFCMLQPMPEKLQCEGMNGALYAASVCVCDEAFSCSIQIRHDELRFSASFPYQL